MANESTPVANAEDRQAKIAACWQDPSKPETTVKPFEVQHGLKFEKDPETAQRLGADGEKIKLFTGSVDIAVLWDETKVPVDVLRSYAAGAIVLNAQQLFKARVLAGKAEPNDQDAMEQAFKDVYSAHATMQGITPSAGGSGNGGAKGPSKKELQEQVNAMQKERELLRQLKEARANGDKKEVARIMEELDALEV